ncbi:hypothetical protein Tco_1090321, partial [Tanacetum coccineum]
MKILIDELESPESNILLPQLLDCDSTLQEELPEIDTFPSFPFENEDKVFNPGILVYGSTHFVTNKVTQDKNLKNKTSSEALLILKERNFLSISSDQKLLFRLELSVTETLLSFSSENEDKVFNPGVQRIENKAKNVGSMPRVTTFVTRGTTNDYLHVRDPEAVSV